MSTSGLQLRGLHGSDKPLHLIAFKEDLELRAQTDAQARAQW